MLYEDVIKGNVRATAKLIRKVDDRDGDFLEELKAIYPHTGKAFLIGITGNPGAGKSTLVNNLIKKFREEDKKVGVIAIDPTSPFSGGAILGDRIRMQKFFNDDKVFIRSVATRGTLGGLSRSTYDIIKVLDAMGNDVVIIETVGVGQDEIEISKLADVSVVVVVPGLGDHIQAIKAGILEIADLFVVNKADLEGVERTVMDLQYMLSMDSRDDNDRPNIIETVAEKNKGIDEFVDELYRLKEKMKTSKYLEKQGRERHKLELFSILDSLIEDKLDGLLTDDRVKEEVEMLQNRKKDPYSLAESLLNEVFI
jgi:LAO/AO transport system kinase